MCCPYQPNLLAGRSSVAVPACLQVREKWFAIYSVNGIFPAEDQLTFLRLSILGVEKTCHKHAIHRLSIHVLPCRSYRAWTSTAPSRQTRDNGRNRSKRPIRIPDAHGVQPKLFGRIVVPSREYGIPDEHHLFERNTARIA